MPLPNSPVPALSTIKLATAPQQYGHLNGAHATHLYEAELTAAGIPHRLPPLLTTKEQAGDLTQERFHHILTEGLRLPAAQLPLLQGMASGVLAQPLDSIVPDLHSVIISLLLMGAWIRAAADRDNLAVPPYPAGDAQLHLAAAAQKAAEAAAQAAAAAASAGGGSGPPLLLQEAMTELATGLADATLDPSQQILMRELGPTDRATIYTMSRNIAMHRTKAWVDAETVRHQQAIWSTTKHMHAFTAYEKFACTTSPKASPAWVSSRCLRRCPPLLIAPGMSVRSWAPGTNFWIS